MPLGISLKEQESVLIGESIFLKISKIKGNKVVVSVNAPMSEQIARIKEYQNREHKEPQDES